MTLEAVRPRIVPIPEREPDETGGPKVNERGCRVPPVALPPEIVMALGRLLVVGVPEGEIAAMLNALADRYGTARKRRESFEVTIVARGHDGKHKEFRWNEDRRL